MISGNFATFIHMSPCRCSFIIGFPTCIVLAATMILPLVAPGFSGSNVTVPEIPLAVPLIDSSGASVLNTTLLTPFGSLKSNGIGAAEDNAASASALRKGTVNRVIVFGLYFGLGLKTNETPA